MHETRFAYAYFQLVAFLIDSVLSGLHHRVLKLELPGDRGEALAFCQYVRAVLYGEVEGFCVRRALAKRFRAEGHPHFKLDAMTTDDTLESCGGGERPVRCAFVFIRQPSWVGIENGTKVRRVVGAELDGFEFSQLMGAHTFLELPPRAV